MEKYTPHFVGSEARVTESVVAASGGPKMDVSFWNVMASSTHGTWLSPFGTRHRLHYMITRLTDADHEKVKVD